MTTYEYSYNTPMERIKELRLIALRRDGRFNEQQVRTLAADKWDQVSDHATVSQNGVLSGSIRLTLYRSAHALPCEETHQEHLQQTKTAIADCAETSRLLVVPGARCSKVCPLLMLLAARRMFEYSNRWLIDVVRGPTGIKLGSYTRLGFVPTGIEDFDPLYNVMCSILEADGGERMKSIISNLERLVFRRNGRIVHAGTGEVLQPLFLTGG